MEHNEIPEGEIHAPHNWRVDTEADRLALAPAAGDLYKYALQLDTSPPTEWMLYGIEPALWIQRSASGGGGGDFSGDYNDLSNKPTLGTAAALNVPASGNAGSGEVVKGNDDRLGDARDTASSRISDATTIGKALLTAASTAAARTTIGAASTSAIGAANGIAPLDSSGLVPSAYLPSYVDDVIEAANFAALPVTGETGKIYVTVDDNKQFRWGGSIYTELVSSPGTTDNVPEGTTNKYFSASGVRAVLLTGLSTVTNAAIAATDGVLGAFGKAQAQISGILTAIATLVEDKTHSAGSKTTPADADELPLVDSAASNVLKRLTWLNLKATLKAYFDPLYAAAGAAGGDMLSMLTSSEVSVTTTATLTVGKMHVCSGTTADYTVTLPAASGNAGKMIGVRMAAGLTRWVTVKGNSAELINGVNTRKMWAGESATLMCDGTGWYKIGGLTIPISLVMKRTTAQSIPAGAWTAVVMNSVVRDNTSGLAVPTADTTNGRFLAPRNSDYFAGGVVCLDTMAAGVGGVGGVSYNSSTPADNPNGFGGGTADNTGFGQYAGSAIFAVSAGEYITATVLHTSSGAKNTRAVGTVLPTLAIKEMPTW